MSEQTSNFPLRPVSSSRSPVTSPGMVADLLQGGQRGQHARIAFGAHTESVGLGAVEQLVVEALLLRGQIADQIGVDLRRQGRGDLKFPAGQHDRLDGVVQSPHGRGGALLDGPDEASPELRLVGERGGRDQIEQRPQFVEMVLHGRTGQRDPRSRGYAPRRPRHLRARILQYLRLIENRGGPIDIGQCRPVAAQRRISGDDHRVGCEIAELRAAPRDRA